MDIRTKAARARGLLNDDRLQAVLSEIEEQAQRDFLASGGDPARMAAAWRQADAVSTLRARLQGDIDAQAVADKREQTHRGP